MEHILACNIICSYRNCGICYINKNNNNNI